MESMTAIWYQKKEKLINGPTIPRSFLQTNNGQIYMAAPCMFGYLHLPMQDAYMSVYDRCSATLNRDHTFKTSANFHNFLPLPPYHRHSSNILMKGIFYPYVGTF